MTDNSMYQAVTTYAKAAADLVNSSVWDQETPGAFVASSPLMDGWRTAPRMGMRMGTRLDVVGARITAL